MLLERTWTLACIRFPKASKSRCCASSKIPTMCFHNFMWFKLELPRWKPPFSRNEVVAICKADCAEKDCQRQVCQTRHQRWTLCAFCKKRGHYRTRCPALAQALLKAVTKHSSVSSLEVFVRTGKTLKVNVPKKPQRTLKRARGKRFFPTPKNATSKKKTRDKKEETC